jgi:hypothetical protein
MLGQKRDLLFQSGEEGEECALTPWVQHDQFFALECLCTPTSSWKAGTMP